jgi:ABC-type glycerol-3-phosphate transport system substrate-binding protein
MMKSFKKWLFALMSALMLLGAATACSDSSTNSDDREVEESDATPQDDGTETDDSNSEQ